jgi:glycerol-3-phosphate acyltransferase PlsY
MEIAAISIAAYLLGSVSFGIVMSRLMGLPDPRSYGSHNTGATNVLRTGRKAAAALTLLGDAGKGWLAVWLALSYYPAAAPFAGFAAFIGHLYPIYHRFQGGKGVATAAGVLLGFDLWLGLGTIATWIAIAAFLRISSLAALVASVFAPFYAFWLFGLQPVSCAVALIGALIIWRHKANIARLVAGTEPRLGQKRAS